MVAAFRVTGALRASAPALPCCPLRRAVRFLPHATDIRKQLRGGDSCPVAPEGHRRMLSTSTAIPPVAPPPPTQPPTKTSVMDVIKIRRRGKRKVTMVTAYDYPSAVHVCRAGIDILLVGDSVGMVELGYDTTQPVTVDDMLHHCQVAHLLPVKCATWTLLAFCVGA